MNGVHPPRTEGWPIQVAGDKGYSYPAAREFLRRRGMFAVIPQRSDQVKRDGRIRHDRTAYRRASVIECCIGWHKVSRRLGTRFEKLAEAFVGIVKLAFLRLYLRLIDPSNTT